MQALDAHALPSNLRSYAGILWHRRAGLQDPAAMPRIERSLADVALQPDWLKAYRTCVGLPAAQDRAYTPMPPLALQIAAAPLHLAILADPQFPFKALGLVHTIQRVVQTRALEAQQRLHLRAYTTRAQWARRGMTFDLVTEALHQGEVVWRGETTALAIGMALGAPATAGIAVPSAEILPPDAPWKQILQATVPEPLGRRYAAIAGDRNPIHQHALLARPFGFPQAIIHGTWTLARALAAADLPDTPGYSLQAHFRKPVSLPSRIVVWARRAAGQDALQVRSEDGSTTHLTVTIIENDAIKKDQA